MSVSMDELKHAIRAVVKEEMSKEERPQPTESHADHILHCPECFAETIKKLEALPYRCDDCGLPLPAEMVGGTRSDTPPCPSCGCKTCHPK